MDLPISLQDITYAENYLAQGDRYGDAAAGASGGARRGVYRR